ncbi:hypothetical protein E2N92_08835 [Methanofollis formosanus]|uniref:Uncharacterized protein n=1 Tax=Methanofollis formosanus TaxID=299308 RepID=A0A8G1A3Q6_9EURY|nr:hypothetical protein [Methanofollis formosanus]QYZ79527.1 hypothetical protein E2N92_08835 [Methanofollis formosanus]
MGERFIFTKHRTVCYHCHEEADQVIKAVSSQAQVVCANCGATRIFLPRVEEVGAEGAYTPISCYEVWHLEPTAPCKNCGVEGPHDLIVGCNQFTTRCHNCGYTHFYKFNLEYIGQCPIEEEEV